MHLYLFGHDFHFELENVCRLFLPLEKVVTFHEEEPVDNDGLMVICRMAPDGDSTLLTCQVRLDGFDESLESSIKNNVSDFLDTCELEMCTLLYHLLVKLLGFTHGWGLITGVRPVKLLRRLTREMGTDAALAYFRDKLLVSDEKQHLCCTTLDAEDRLLSLSAPNSFSLYVSIPFCPTRCDYCSFVSQTVVQAKKLIPTYVEQLCREIAYTGQLAKQLGLRLETVYFGGGTPTTLSAEPLIGQPCENTLWKRVDPTRSPLRKWPLFMQPVSVV